MILTDPLDPARAAALMAALGMPFDPAAPLPPFAHHVYFWQVLPPAALGRDGHPRPGTGVIPQIGLPRRMWAGGRLAFHASLWAGSPATRTTICESVQHKEGRSGPLALVTLRHEVAQGGRLCVEEWQDLVYRPDRVAPAQAPHAPEGAEEEAPFAPDAVLLFRYSALTMNGHRIHYDVDYARTVEGYPGPVVHGPLLAQMLVLMARRRGVPLTRFRYRATAPLILGEAAGLCAAGERFWVRGPAGRLCMEATAA